MAKSRFLFVFVDKKAYFYKKKVMIDYQHPIFTNGSEIEERGLLVLENITHMPSYDEPIVSPYLIIALNLRGWVRVEYDMRHVEFRENETVVIYPNHVLVARESSDDYLAVLVVISQRFYRRIRSMHPSHYHFEYHYNTQYRLSDVQLEGLLSCYRLLKIFSEMDHPNREDLLASQMEVTAHLVETYFEENGTMVSTSQPQARRMTLFHAYIAEHFKESREVGFYAELLHLTPKHFGTIVRKTTGIGARDWIGQYVVIQAKNLLRNRQNMSIQQISNDLGFSDQTTFSRYFKKYSGQTPSEYRNKTILRFVE